MNKNVINILLSATMGLYALTNMAQPRQDDVLLTIEDQEISVAEFERVYNKNASIAGSETDSKTVAEYLDMYINFKLKVKEAERLKYDTVESFKKELDQYVTQLQQPYLTDENYIQELVAEAYERMKYDIRASHIMVALEENASPQDTLKAYKEAYKIYKEAQTGVDFADLAKRKSEDPSVKQNDGDLGWFSAFRMVYEFENAAYNTPKGEVSGPVRSRFGYHIIKVNDKREAMPEMQVAHIMIRHDKDEDKNQSEAKKQIEEIHQKLNNGEDFATLAKHYSDDKGSAQRGGTLPRFKTGRMVPDFEEAVYHLEKRGQITAPFETDFGRHIAVLLDRVPLGSFEEEEENIRRNIDRDNRGADSQKRLALKLAEEYGVKTKAKHIASLENLIDSVYFAGKRKNHPLQNVKSKTIMRWKDKTYGTGKHTFTQKDFAQYLLSINPEKELDPSVYVCESFDDFKVQKILDFEKSILPQKHPEFAALKNEYREGILLFSLMNDKIWSRANTDTAGLESFYNANIQNYMWPQRYDVTSYIANDENTADEIMLHIESGKTDSAIISMINEQNSLGVKVRNAKIEKENNLLADVQDRKPGISKIQNEGEWYIVKINEVLEPRPKTIDEARGSITSDYQDQLEKEWLKELREKFQWSVNEEILNELSEKYK